jgi:hypothetical protein
MAWTQILATAIVSDINDVTLIGGPVPDLRCAPAHSIWKGMALAFLTPHLAFSCA